MLCALKNVIVVFKTDLDEAKSFSWPIMDFPPTKGDIITSIWPIRDGVYLELEVGSRRFYQNKELKLVCECELKLPQSRHLSIADFEKWFQRIKYGQ